MIGLELNINGQAITAGLEKGSVNIITNNRIKNTKEVKQEYTCLTFSGLESVDSETSKMFRWYKNDLKIDDKFTIKIVDVTNNSKPIKQEIVKTNTFIIDSKLKTYHKLKKELEALGEI